MGCGIIFPRDFNFNKQNFNNINQQNEPDEFQNNCLDDLDHLSQSSHSGAENDSPFSDSDENSDFLELDQDWIAPNQLLEPSPNDFNQDPWGPPPVGRPNRPKHGQHEQNRKLKLKDDDYRGLKVDVYFTRNGIIIGQKQVSIPRGGFFPTIGMLSTAEKVKVDLHPLTG